MTIIIIITITKIIITTNFTGTAVFFFVLIFCFFFFAAFLQQKSIESKSTIRIAGKIVSSNVQMIADKLLKKASNAIFQLRVQGQINKCQSISVPGTEGLTTSPGERARKFKFIPNFSSLFIQGHVFFICCFYFLDSCL